MYIVKMLHAPSRAIKDIEIDSEWDESSDYLWGEGNYSCDHNRILFFHNWEKEAEDEGVDCSTRHYVILSIMSGGQQVYESEVE